MSAATAASKTHRDDNSDKHDGGEKGRAADGKAGAIDV